MPNARRARAWQLAVLAAAALACGDDTSVVVVVGQPVQPGPPAPPPGGGTVVVVTSTPERDARKLEASRAASRGEARSAGTRPRVHASQVYLPSPRGAERIAAEDHAVAADPGTGGKNYDDDTNIDFGYDTAPRHAFLRARLTDIPRKARILRATLQILARFGNAERGCDVYVGLVPKDGLWDELSRPRHWNQAPSFDGIATARDAAGQALATTELTVQGTANFGLEDTGEMLSLVSSTEVGQSMTVSAAGTLAEVQVQLRRVGTLPGDTRLRVERSRADDGSDDRPDGVPLGVSEPIEAGAIGSGFAGSPVTYAFAAGPTLEQGGRYAFILESDSIGNASNHLQWKIHHHDQYAAGGLVNHGLKVGWNVVAYPSVNQLPFFFHEDRITPRAPAFGTLRKVEVPAFPGADVWVDVADLTTQLQEWVDGPSYVRNDVVAIQLFTAASTPAGALRRGKDFRVEVTWVEPHAPHRARPARRFP